MACIRWAFLAVLIATAGATGACSSSGPASHPRRLTVIAGENFWGSITSQLAGHEADVTSVVTDPNADPHNYETNAETARAFATADLVVLNGAGYDAWASKLIAANPNDKRKVLVVADLLGKREGDNPHFWYSPRYVAIVADRIEAELQSIDPPASAYFAAQRRAFDTSLGPLNAHLAAIKARFAGVPVAATESVFVYLGDYLGLDIISPPGFMNAVAEGSDPPAPSVARFQDQIATRQAKTLVYNLQTATAVTTNLRRAATVAGVPTCAVTETIQPPFLPFQQWLDGELTHLAAALTAGTAQ